MYIIGDEFLFRGTKEEYEADQKARKEDWEQDLKQMEKDRNEKPWIFEDNPFEDYEGDKGDALEDSF